jgi:HAD superfamily hydrolase (TIGR01549 family)
MNVFKLIIFDLDGVLWISNDAHVEVCMKALDAAGIRAKIDPKALTYFFGLPYREVLMAVMGDEYTPEKLEAAFIEQQKLIYSDSFFDKVEEIDGVKELLVELKGRGIKLAVASGNERAFLDKAIEYLKLSSVFDVVVSADDVACSKPDPEMLQKAMSAVKVKSNQTLFVGDARNDVLAAKKAKVTSAIVLTGVLNAIEAEELDPDFILDSVLDVEFLL